MFGLVQERWARESVGARGWLAGARARWRRLTAVCLLRGDEATRRWAGWAGDECRGACGVGRWRALLAAGGRAASRGGERQGGVGRAE